MFEEVKEALAKIEAAAPCVSNALAVALVEAQKEMENPVFDSENPHFHNKFASMAAVRNMVVPILTKHGISISQDLTTLMGPQTGVACTTILTHISGQQMKFGPLVIPVTTDSAQDFGKASTYAKRYSMMAIAAIVGDFDDDSGGDRTQPVTEFIGAGQVAKLEGLISEVKSNRDSFLRYLKVDSLDKIQTKNFQAAVAALEAKREKVVPGKAT
jgi:hypothetical protein